MNTKIHQQHKALINVTNGTACSPNYTGDLPIGDSFTLRNSGGLEFNYIVVNPEQAAAFERVVAHQGKDGKLREIASRV